MDNGEKYIGEEEKHQVIKGAQLFMVVLLVITLVLSCLFYFSGGNDFLSKVENPKELEQAILICSTALMGLSGLILIEIKKTNIPVSEDAEDMFKKVKALNLILDLLKADTILRWSLLLSLITIIFGCLRLIESNSLFMLISLASFFDQLMFFIWGLLFGHFLPE